MSAAQISDRPTAATKPAGTNADTINYVNIGLMILSAGAAFVLPFEVFLFAYAVLGPLHYLTEISWLHERGYFTKGKRDYLFLAILAAVLLGLGFGLPLLVPKNSPYLEASQSWATSVIYLAFASALVMIALKEPIKRFFALSLVALTAWFLKDFDTTKIIFAVFLPTLLHVFVFTGAFLLYGALKTRSKSGILSFVVFLACPIALYLANYYGTGRVLPNYVEDSYLTFAALNQTIIKLLHLGDANTKQDIFYSSYGTLVMRFIAFAYTYHYLNWFSKTSVIQWHKVSKPRLTFIIVAWLAAVCLYAINYRTGFIWLYCLSFMHVFLEFPLNHVTFLGIGKEIGKLVRGRQGFGTEPAK